MLLNNYYTKQSKEFNLIIQKNPQFKNLINDLVGVRLKDYIIDINFIYSILHPDSILYEYIKTDFYDVVLDKLVDYMIENGIAKKIESISKDITLPVGLFNYPLNEDLYFEHSIIDMESIFDDSDMHLLYCAHIENFDILTDVYCMEQLSDSFVEDFDLMGYQLYHR